MRECAARISIAHREAELHGSAPAQGFCLVTWPLHDIAMANSVWYILQSLGFGGGDIILRNSVGDDGVGWAT